jgi:hypothetical protein
MRSKNIDVRSNCGYNLLNGSNRLSVDVPTHKVYNPPDAFRTVGEAILGSGFAGKPIRGELYKIPNSAYTQNQMDSRGMASQGKKMF